MYDDIGETPNTPLMEEGPTGVDSNRGEYFLAENNDQDVSDQHHILHQQELDEKTKRRNKLACIGVLIVSCIIALALIIVGVKEATSDPEYLKINSQKDMVESSTPLDTFATDQTNIIQNTDSYTVDETTLADDTGTTTADTLTVEADILNAETDILTAETDILAAESDSITDDEAGSAQDDNTNSDDANEDDETDFWATATDVAPTTESIATTTVPDQDTATEDELLQEYDNALEALTELFVNPNDNNSDNQSVDELSVDSSDSNSDNQSVDDPSVDSSDESADNQSFDTLAVDPSDNDTNLPNEDTPIDTINQNFDDIRNGLRVDEDNILETEVQSFGEIEEEISDIDGGDAPVGTSVGGINPALDTPDERSSGPVVYCDPVRERRCRDKTQCYPVAKYCDLEVDCNDYSDEDECTCKDRLIDARMCDGYDDCIQGEDEWDCKCPQDQFFCDMEAFDKPICKNKELVCDGVEDCENGKDEEGCIVNFPHTLNLTEARPGFSHSSGLLTVKLDEEYKYLAVREDQHHLIASLALRTCDGLIDFEEVFYKVVEYEYDMSKAAIIDYFNMENGRYTFSSNDGSNEHIHLVHVRCQTKLCSAYSSVEKRAPAHNIPEEYGNWTSEQLTNAVANGTIDMKTIDESHAKIVGGTDSHIRLWPSTVALYRNTKFICGGTLINPNWIITAGHCLYKYEKKDKFYRIRIGMQRKDSQSPWEQNRIITEVYMHPEYEPTFLRNDVSLGKLDRPLMINQYSQPICLPFNPQMTPEPGRTCTAAGWGLVSEKGLASEQLKEVKLHVLTECWRSYNNEEFQICAGAKLGQDSCQGDSGGPLYCQSDEGENYLGGVISHGKGCGRKGEPGVYVRLSKYYEWIETVLAGTVPKKDEPILECPGLMCGTGECVATSNVCDEKVNCQDNGDVRYCKVVNGNRVQVLPAGVQLYDRPDLGNVNEDPFEEKEDESSEHDNGHGHGHGNAAGSNDSDDHSDTANIAVFDTSNLPQFIKISADCSDSEFKCSRIEQCFPQDKKCDGIFDCKDKSDEIGCKCGDVLRKENPSLVNNGIKDCQDGSDEMEVMCEPDEFRCPGTKRCISLKDKCNSRRDCPGGEDEENCAVLVTDKNVLVSTSGEVIKSDKGYLAIFTKGKWKPICVHGFTNEFTKNICNFMGFSDGSFKLISKGDSPLNTGGVSRSCFHVYLDCGPARCGDSVAVRERGLDIRKGSVGSGGHPWTVSILSDGEYVCSASIIHPKYIIASWDCGVSVLTKKGYVTVVGGQDDLRTYGLTPKAQIRRLGKFKVIQGSKVLIANLDSPFEVTSFVRHLCRGKTNWKSTNKACYISGKTGDNLHESYPVEIAGKCSDDDNMLCSCESDDVNTDSCKLNIQGGKKDTRMWGGALACPDKTGAYSYVGLNINADETKPTQFVNLVTSEMFKKIPGLIINFERVTFDFEEDDCTHRCVMGNCVEEESLCDGKWDCIDGSDEKNCSVSQDIATCRKIDSTDTCYCPQYYGKCDNNVCISMTSYCDGYDDCGDNSDETEDCQDCLARLMFASPDKVCDGISDCQLGEDEDPSLCGCQEDEFLCKHLSGDENDYPYCQPRTNLCDGRKHCESGADEASTTCISLGSTTDLSSTDLLPSNSSFGDLQIRMKGKWHVYCTSSWVDDLGTPVCNMLGFSQKYISIQKKPDRPVVDVGYLETGIESPPCKTIYLVCSSD